MIIITGFVSVSQSVAILSPSASIEFKLSELSSNFEIKSFEIPCFQESC